MWRFRYCHEQPWSLARRDLDDDLKELATQAVAPTDETVRNVCTVLHIDYSREEIKGA